jgi:PRC-barrel domain
MLKPLALAVALAVTVATSAAQDLSNTAIGLPVFTSDGREIGLVTEVASEPLGQSMLIAEVERPGGIGPRAVAIPPDMFVQRADRIELSLTFEQVTDRLAGPEYEP